MTLVTRLLGTPEPTTPQPSDIKSTFNWAVVQTLAPITIRFDGQTQPVTITPDSMVDPTRLVVGSRVWVQQWGKRLLILGVGNDAILPPTPPATTTYTPDWLNLATGTPLSNGTGGLLTGEYCVGADKWVRLDFILIRGTGANVGTGAYAWTTPIAANDYRLCAGTGFINKAGVETALSLRFINSTTMVLLNTTGRISNVNPGTWATNDELHGAVVYRTT